MLHLKIHLENMVILLPRKGTITLMRQKMMMEMLLRFVKQEKLLGNMFPMKRIIRLK